MSSVTPAPLPASYTAVRPYTATLEMWTRRAPARRAASITSRVPPTLTRVYSSRAAGVTTSAAPRATAADVLGGGRRGDDAPRAVPDRVPAGGSALPRNRVRHVADPRLGTD